MSHAVVRGKPTAAQLYLDGVLDEVLVSQGEVPDARARGGVTLPQVLFHCLQKNPDNIFMINGVTGERTTNGQALKQAIPLTRTLVSMGLRGKVVMVLMVADQPLSLALLLAGTIPFYFYPIHTVYEISHFLELIQPSVVFYEARYSDDLKKALESLPDLQPKVMEPSKLDSLDTRNMPPFQLPDASPDDTVMLLPTSGSTGLPKACLLTHRGFVTKLPAPWYRSSKFPTPTSLMAIMSLPGEIVYHRLLASCVVFGVPLLLPCALWSEEWMKTALLTYRPTWASVRVIQSRSLLRSGITAEHLSSLQCLTSVGCDPGDKIRSAYMNLLPKSAILEETYGMTEAHGVVATSENGEPFQWHNTFEYKLIDEDGNSLSSCSTGELCLKGPAVIKGYYRNSCETVKDGWYRTGDVFYVDEEEILFYRERKSTCFKFMGKQVSCEEVERVVGSVPGVSACAVSRTDAGAAAAVVAQGVTREDIHNAVQKALSVAKHLHGGVGFVPALPVSHAGKLDRTQCNKLIQHLAANGHCY